MSGQRIWSKADSLIGTVQPFRARYHKDGPESRELLHPIAPTSTSNPKSEILSTKQYLMTQIQIPKQEPVWSFEIGFLDLFRISKLDIRIWCQINPKSEILSTKQYLMTQIGMSKTRYCFEF